MSQIRSAVASAILIALVVHCGSASPSLITPAALYQKALNADLNYSYTGKQTIKSFREDGRVVITVTTVTHSAPDDFKIVYALPVRDAGRTIVEDGSQQWTYLPRRDILLHTSGIIPLTRKQVSAKYALLKTNYSLELGPLRDVVAGRKVVELLITPRDKDGKVSKLWIDPLNGMVLRKEQYHAGGAIASVTSFSSIDFSQAIRSDAFALSRIVVGKPRIEEISNPDETLIKRSDVGLYFNRTAVLPERMAGFELQSLAILHQGKYPILHLRYSDGLASLSLFETQRSSKLPTFIAHSRPVKLNVPSSGRAVQRYSYSLLNWDSARLNLTLVGDEKVSSLVKLAELLRVAY